MNTTICISFDDAMFLQLKVTLSGYLLSQNQRNNIRIKFMQIIHTLSTELQMHASFFPAKFSTEGMVWFHLKIEQSCSIGKTRTWTKSTNFIRRGL